MIGFDLEKSPDDHGYCLVQLIDKGKEVVRRVISRIWAEPNEEHPGRQRIRYWTHAAEGVTTLVRDLPEDDSDNYMRKYLVSA